MPNCANHAVLPKLGDLFVFTYRVAPANPETFEVIQVLPKIRLMSHDFNLKIYEFFPQEWEKALEDFIPKPPKQEVNNV